MLCLRVVSRRVDEISPSALNNLCKTAMAKQSEITHTCTCNVTEKEFSCLKNAKKHVDPEKVIGIKTVHGK